MKSQLTLIVCLCTSLLAGCSDPSLKIAIQSQRHADEIQNFLFQQQHDGLVMYLYRDLAAELATEETPLSQDQLTTLNSAWNERDLIEHWAIQHERAKALRQIGVNTRLYSQQSIVDLIGKSISQRSSAVNAVIAGQVAESAAGDVVDAAQEELSDGR
jgi:hypothetical protein